MKGRLVFKNRIGEIITSDIDITLKDTKGIYSSTKELGRNEFEFVGLQWLAEEL